MRLHAVGKRYGLRQPWVVSDVTGEITAGRLIRLEGPNGSGKSTLLRVIAGVTRPSAGRVTGRPRAGYVPERFPAALGFSAREYLTHLGRIHGLATTAAESAADDWLDRLGAAEYARAPLRTLSKGMCQKVAVAQALLAAPELVVLDEAWTGLDQAARGALDDAVADRVAAGSSVLFVDHDPARLAGRADERWQLSGGTVTVLAGRAAAATETAGPASHTATIELTGIEPESLPRVAALTGLVAVDHPRPGVARLTVAAAASDTTLRELLSWDGVHLLTFDGNARSDPGQ